MKIKNVSFFIIISLFTVQSYAMEKETAKKNEKQHGNSTKSLTLKKPKTQPLAEQYDETDTLSDDDISLQSKRLIAYATYFKDPKNKWLTQ